LRPVQLPASDDTACIVAKVRSALADNAAVLVVRNTVRDAVATTKALEAVGVSVLLHHGRFAPEDRRRLDELVEAALGKQRNAGAACVVATQTCEQSLDVDADVLITDLCPADVLLQRIGRLHRHARTDRPARWARATTLVLTPPGGVEPLLKVRRPALGLGVVYRDLRVIQRTLEEITERGHIEVPNDCRGIVELTTHPDVLTGVSDRSHAWHQHGEKVDGEAFAAGGIAAVACVDRTAPWGDRRIASARDVGDEAVTRLGAKDVRIEVNWRGAVVPRIGSVTLPGRLLPGVDPETIVAGAADIVAGRRRFTYGRYGLEWESL
jgi:CRISPR-associated endonuclease/helicase Cas3